MSLNNHTEGLDVNLLITGGKHGYLAYRVTGASRVPTINRSDLIFVDARKTPTQGDVVMLRENGLNSVEIFKPQLRLANSVPAQNQTIIGVVTSALRTFAEVSQ
jgi:signal peptidase I